MGEGAVSQNTPKNTKDKVVLRTIVAGLQARESSVGLIEGVLIDRSFIGPQKRREIERIQSQLEKKSKQDWCPIPDRTMFVIRFVIAPRRYRYEVLALYGGPNDWGVDSCIGLLGPGRRTLPLPVQVVDPRVLFVGDGSQETMFNVFNRTAYIRPQRVFVETCMQPPFNQLFAFGASVLRNSEAIAVASGFPLSIAADSRMKGAGITYSDTKVEYFGEFKEGDITLMNIRTAVTTNHGDRIQESYFVAPSLGFAVIRDEWVLRSLANPEVGVSGTYRASNFREVAPQIFLPHKIVMEHFSYKAGVSDPWYLTRVVEFKDLKANREPNDKDFALDLPLGTTVLDEIRTTSEVVGGFSYQEAIGPDRSDANPQTPDPRFRQPLPSVQP